MKIDVHSSQAGVKTHVLLSYIADLELEVDRLRSQGHLSQQETRETLGRIQRLCTTAQTTDPPQDIQLTEREEILNEIEALARILHDLRETPAYHPAYDQVVPIALRPLIEQVFAWQQRLWKAPELILRLELECEHVEWFPARLRHVVDNLISNAVRYRDSSKGETRVTVGMRALRSQYELIVSDNGIGMPAEACGALSELFHRSAPARLAGFGVGFSVAKMLIEQSGGSLTCDSGAGQGTTVAAILPRYDSQDFLE